MANKRRRSRVEIRDYIELLMEEYKITDPEGLLVECKEADFDGVLAREEIELATNPIFSFTKEKLGEIKKSAYNKSTIKKKYFITGAVAGAKASKKALQSVDNWIDANKGEFIIMPVRAHVRALVSQPMTYDEDLLDYMDRFSTDYILNKNVRLFELGLNPQQANPLTGVSVVVGDNLSSLIIGHTKQDMEIQATGNNTHPRMLHSTGVITHPNYLSNRVGLIAKETHVMGGLIVEVESEKEFHVRAVRFNSDGSFIDLGTKYHPDGKTSQVRAEAFVLGDLHAGREHKDALKRLYRLWDKKLRPKKVFLHDLVDGAHASPHSSIFDQMNDNFEPKNLKEELEHGNRLITEIWSNTPEDCKIYVVPSNHNDFIDRWLVSGKYVNDKDNFIIGHEMALLKASGKSPIKPYVDPEGLLEWPSRDTDITVNGVQLNFHGDRLSGMRAGVNKIKKTYPRGVVHGHTHTPSIRGSVYSVGHTSLDRHGYNHGPSTWIKSSAAVYPGGVVQIINQLPCGKFYSGDK